MRKLPLLGELTQHATIPEWWISRPFPVRFLEKAIPFTLIVRADSDQYPHDVNEAVARFVALGPSDLAIATRQAFDYYRQFVDAVPDVDLGIDGPEHVWPRVQVRYAAIQRKGPVGAMCTS